MPFRIGSAAELGQVDDIRRPHFCLPIMWQRINPGFFNIVVEHLSFLFYSYLPYSWLNLDHQHGHLFGKYQMGLPRARSQVTARHRPRLLAHYPLTMYTNVCIRNQLSHPSPLLLRSQVLRRLYRSLHDVDLAWRRRSLWTSHARSG